MPGVGAPCGPLPRTLTGLTLTTSLWQTPTSALRLTTSFRTGSRRSASCAAVVLAISDGRAHRASGQDLLSLRDSPLRGWGRIEPAFNYALNAGQTFPEVRQLPGQRGIGCSDRKQNRQDDCQSVVVHFTSQSQGGSGRRDGQPVSVSASGLPSRIGGVRSLLQGTGGEEACQGQFGRGGPSAAARARTCLGSIIP